MLSRGTLSPAAFILRHRHSHEQQTETRPHSAPSPAATLWRAPGRPSGAPGWRTARPAPPGRRRPGRRRSRGCAARGTASARTAHGGAPSSQAMMKFMSCDTSARAAVQTVRWAWQLATAETTFLEQPNALPTYALHRRPSIPGEGRATPGAPPRPGAPRPRPRGTPGRG